MNCENCGRNRFENIGEDEIGNSIVECQSCGSVAYEDGTLVEEETITITE